jgi:hypothetical protein
LDVAFYIDREFSINPKNGKNKGVIMKLQVCNHCWRNINWNNVENLTKEDVCIDCKNINLLTSSSEKRLKIDVGTAKFVSDLAVKELNRLYEEENTGFIFNLGQPKIMFREV